MACDGAPGRRFAPVQSLESRVRPTIKDRGFNRADAIFPTETQNEIARFLPLPSQQARVARKLFDGIGDFARIGRREAHLGFLENGARAFGIDLDHRQIAGHHFQRNQRVVRCGKNDADVAFVVDLHKFFRPQDHIYPQWQGSFTPIEEPVDRRRP